MIKLLLLLIGLVSFFIWNNIETQQSIKSTHYSKSDLTSNTINRSLSSVNSQVNASTRPPQNWSMLTTQHNPNHITSNNSDSLIRSDRWKHDTLNGAYISPNAWGFGGYAGGAGQDSNLKDAFVKWKYEAGKDAISLEWFVGGYHRDFNNKPGIGWFDNNENGGNNVKAYPRIGIGSASGQPYATSGTPRSMPTVTTGGTKTVDQNIISRQIGLPSRVESMPEIDIHIDMQFSGGSNAVDSKDQYGNYYFAIDSYFHNIDDTRLLTNPALKENLNGINDSSGDIYNTKMDSLGNEPYQKTTKRWAMMIWYHKPAYYISSGGTPLNNNQTVNIDGGWYFVKYKIENAGGKLFKYIAFVRDRTSSELTQGGQQPIIRYKRFAEFMTGNRLQQLLDEAGPLEDVDGVKKRIIVPSKKFVLSDINVGVEISANPDTANDQTPKPVKITFKNLYFNVNGKGEFGFKTSNPSNNSQGSNTATTPPPLGYATYPPCDTNNGQGSASDDGRHWNSKGDQCKPTSNTPSSQPNNVQPPTNNQLPTCTNNNGQGNIGGDGRRWSEDGKECQPVNSSAQPTTNNQLPTCTNNNGQGNIGGDGRRWSEDGKECQPVNNSAQPTTNNQLPTCTNNNGQGNIGGDGRRWSEDGKECQPVNNSAQIPTNMQLPTCTTNNGQGNIGDDGRRWNTDGKQCQPTSNSSNSNVRQVRSVLSTPAINELPVCKINNGKGNIGSDGRRWNSEGKECQPTNSNAQTPTNNQLPTCTTNNGQGNIGSDGRRWNSDGKQCQPTSSSSNSDVRQIRSVPSTPAINELPICTNNNGQGNIGSDGRRWTSEGKECRQGPANNTSNKPTPNNKPECIDPDGDGYGWDGSKSCTVKK